MEILIHGMEQSPKTTKLIKTFKCPDCGCLFKANHDEYHALYRTITSPCVCNCPEPFCNGVGKEIDYWEYR